MLFLARTLLAGHTIRIARKVGILSRIIKKDIGGFRYGTIDHTYIYIYNIRV